MKETERARGGDVVGGRLSRTTSVSVFSPGRGGVVIPLDLVIGKENVGPRIQGYGKKITPNRKGSEHDDREK